MTILFEREDWTLFRSLGTLGQRAGVPVESIPALVAKELADNALDAAGACEVGLCSDDGCNGFYVRDNGTGIPGTDAAIAKLFSVSRSYVSSKLIRLPTRGALGNGLRVVAGAVLATGGKLFVSTCGRRLQLSPNDDGKTTVVGRQPCDTEGTKVEVYFGDALAFNQYMLAWAQMAVALAQGDDCKGKTSPYWYDSDTFYELLQAAGGRWVRDMIGEFDGCTGANAGKIAAAFLERTCNSLSREDAEQLLDSARSVAKPVKAYRLGRIGEDALDGQYARTEGEITIPAARGRTSAVIPFAVEAWAVPVPTFAASTGGKRDEINLTLAVNKTPITAKAKVVKQENQIAIFGAGLNHYVAKLGRTNLQTLSINVQTPFMPITSDGKAPNLKPMLAELTEAIGKAVSKAKRMHRPAAGKPRTQRDIVLANVEECSAKVSQSGRYRFSQRQLFYAVRPLLIDETGKEPDYDNFCKILTDYENIYGDIPGMYRDSRGTLYHPHTGERLAIGTLSVERYQYPEWTFNKILYIEKEGLFEILIDEQWPEIHDCVLVTTKGQATRAVKDLLDLMGKKGEPLTFFCVHDADAAGTTIYEALQNETRSRPGREVEIINLGLDPWEALEMGLQVEQVEKKKERRGVGAYVPSRWAEWLQHSRVELNAMPSDMFLDWLNKKMEEHGARKLIPPPQVITEQMQEDAEHAVKNYLTERILADVNLDDQVGQILSALKLDTSEVQNTITGSLYATSNQSWRKPVKGYAQYHAEQLVQGWDWTEFIP